MAATELASEERRPLWLFRGPLFVGSLVGLGFALVAFDFPAPFAQTALYWLAGALLLGCMALAWFSVRFAPLQRPNILRWSTQFGLLCGFF